MGLSARQKLALSAALYAVGYERGRTLLDPVFAAVTEGRQRAGYSGCGDLGHFVVMLLGHRSKWNNRDELFGWDNQVNISRLLPIARKVRIGEILQPGDIYIGGVADPALTHVGVIYSDSPTETVTLDYGQSNRDPHTNTIGARMRRRKRVGGKLGPRTVDYVIRPDELETQVAPESIESYARRKGLPPPRPLFGSHAAWYVAVLVAGAAGAVAGYSLSRAA